MSLSLASSDLAAAARLAIQFASSLLWDHKGFATCTQAVALHSSAKTVVKANTKEKWDVNQNILKVENYNK